VAVISTNYAPKVKPMKSQPRRLRQQTQLRHQAHRVLVIDDARQLAVLPLVDYTRFEKLVNK
jgi:hypothetical protein